MERLVDPLTTIDAKLWADEFMKVKARLGEPKFDHAMMLGWFANAIMQGYDEGQRRAKADAQATAEALRRERDDAVLLRDHNLRRCDVLDSKYKKGLAAVKVLQSQLSQLQALVRAYLEARKSIDSDLAEQARENLKHALDATTPAECTNHFTDGSKIFPSRNCCSKGSDGEEATK